MANYAVLWNNIANNGTPAASTQASATMAATNLLTDDVWRKWRGSGGTSDYVTLNFSTTQTADTFGVIGLGDPDFAVGAFGLTGTVRIRLSSADTTGAAGDIWDSTALSGEVDPDYQKHIKLTTTKSGWKTIRWDFAQAGASYIQAGRLVVGTRTAFTYNPDIGSNVDTYVDPSEWTENEAGLFILPKRGYFTHEIRLSWIDATQRYSVMRALDLAVGSHKDVLLSYDTASASPGRDSMWGPVYPNSPVSGHPQSNDLYSRTMRFRQR